ncbi:Cytochrome c oxidase assembly component [Komagataella phaffii CBS 7435]|uniref:SURF1-like protein n=2 Tax=Komagataella phaffii TaxID=460519 RepID=C4QX26_KOMPG|nr:Mitochondrial inner membrane protein required for assembly of cytochrome c oxidase (complex IV) [Komagataella phaffii GS115]AOA61016.1 GQ67_02226T0 [Komagataella phaffii]CAH2446598.1 Cytochrome c oxidase assembly component [Komagataella phaffii CBS 7435]AOA66570.1 GQ68_02240T0 [Komagataella phaffii GS115]CAY67799.1 Mitochondrial inner membrane protein required for assembly of cytochrome c oxidase (complex IV) [Komagataella phaffii GS115]CCA36883.1 Cytochrome c oxidase assembly component [Ko
MFVRKFRNGTSISLIRRFLHFDPPKPPATPKTLDIDWKPITSNKSLKRDGNKHRTGRSVVFGLLCLTPVVTLGLGFWQLQRLKWKNSLVAECEDRLTYKPLPLPKNFREEDVENFEYRKVLITGRFDYEKELLVGPRLHDDRKGYILVTPFTRSNGGGRILVERGWISEGKVNQGKRRLKNLSMPEGTITLECLLKVPPSKGMFHIEHKPGTNMFRYVDLERMCKETNCKPIYAQVVQDFKDHPEWLKDRASEIGHESSGGLWNLWRWRWQSESDNNDDQSQLETFRAPMVGEAKVSAYQDSSLEFSPLQFVNAGVPIGKVPKVDYTNNHLNYLVTWWGLSLASTVLLLLVLKSKKFVNPSDEKLRHARKYM